MEQYSVPQFTEEELDYYQPDITKAMKRLSSFEKSYIIRKCVKEHLKNLKLKEKNGQKDQKN